MATNIDWKKITSNVKLVTTPALPTDGEPVRFLEFPKPVEDLYFDAVLADQVEWPSDMNLKFNKKTAPIPTTHKPSGSSGKVDAALQSHAVIPHKQPASARPPPAEYSSKEQVFPPNSDHRDYLPPGIKPNSNFLVTPNVSFCIGPYDGRDSVLKYVVTPSGLLHDLAVPVKSLNAVDRVLNERSIYQKLGKWHYGSPNNAYIPPKYVLAAKAWSSSDAPQPFILFEPTIMTLCKFIGSKLQPILDWISIETVIDLIRQILDGVRSIHEDAKYIHGNLTMEHIHFTKVGDATNGGGIVVLNLEYGQPIGSQPKFLPPVSSFVAPELQSSGFVNTTASSSCSVISTASDIYSIGVIIREIIVALRVESLDTSVKNRLIKLERLTNECCRSNPSERPTISALIDSVCEIAEPFVSDLSIAITERALTLFIPNVVLIWTIMEYAVPQTACNMIGLMLRALNDPSVFVPISGITVITRIVSTDPVVKTRADASFKRFVSLIGLPAIQFTRDILLLSSYSGCIVHTQISVSTSTGDDKNNNNNKDNDDTVSSLQTFLSARYEESKSRSFVFVIDIMTPKETIPALPMDSVCYCWSHLQTVLGRFPAQFHVSNTDSDNCSADGPNSGSGASCAVPVLPQLPDSICELVMNTTSICIGVGEVESKRPLLLDYVNEDLIINEDLINK